MPSIIDTDVMQVAILSTATASKYKLTAWFGGSFLLRRRELGGLCDNNLACVRANEEDADVPIFKVCRIYAGLSTMIRPLEY